jgi:hypothetical protein
MTWLRLEGASPEDKMTKQFRMQDNGSAKLNVEIDGYTVTVTVEPPRGTEITTEDADVILTGAMGQFPQRVRFGPR